MNGHLFDHSARNAGGVFASNPRLGGKPGSLLGIWTPASDLRGHLRRSVLAAVSARAMLSNCGRFPGALGIVLSALKVSGLKLRIGRMIGRYLREVQ